MSQQFTFGQPVLYAGKRYLYLGMEGPDAAIARVLDTDGKWDSESVHPATLTAITPPAFDEWCKALGFTWLSDGDPKRAYKAGQNSMSVSAPIPVEGDERVEITDQVPEEVEPEPGYEIVEGWDANEIQSDWRWFNEYPIRRGWNTVLGLAPNWAYGFQFAGGRMARPKVETPKTEAAQEDYGFVQEMIGPASRLRYNLGLMADRMAGYPEGMVVKVTVTKIQEEGSK